MVAPSSTPRYAPGLDGHLRSVDDLVLDPNNARAHDEKNLAAIEAEAPGTDARNLRAVLGRFDPIWDALHLSEKKRLLGQLIEQVAFDREKGTVEFTLKGPGRRDPGPGGRRMSRRTVTIYVATEGKGRQRLRQGEAPEAEEPPEKVPRVARLLALAHRWNDLIQEGAVKNRAELSRIVGVSRARVTQVMRLLDLAPQIQEAVLFGEVDGKGAERALRRMSQGPVWARQCSRYLTSVALPNGVSLRLRG